jgi:hypothetical protein
MSVTIRPSQLQNNALIRRVVNASFNLFSERSADDETPQGLLIAGHLAV